MSVCKSVGNLVSMFKNPYKNLTHELATGTIGEKLSEFELLDLDDHQNQNKLMTKIWSLGSGIQLSLAVFNHDWEKGRLDLTAEDSLFHAIGVNYDVNLLYWYCLQYGSLFIPILRDVESTKTSIQNIMGQFFEQANYLDRRLAAGYKVGSMGEPIDRETIAKLGNDRYPPIFKRNKLDFTLNMSGANHQELVDWVTPKYTPLELNEITRIKHFINLLAAIFHAYEVTTNPTSMDVEALILRLLYAITYSYECGDVFTLSEVDRHSKHSYEITTEQDIAFPLWRDTNLIINRESEIWASRNIS